MTVEEYFEEWWTSKKLPENGFNKTAMLDFAEMYHKQALRIHNVARQSEQLVCDCGNRLTDKEIYFGQCLQCNKNIEEAN